MRTEILPQSIDTDKIKDSFINYLKTKPQFKGFNFAGDDLNVILDILAGNTTYNIFYQHQSINERFSQSAQKRSQLVRLAQSAGVLPASARAASAIVRLTLTSTDPTDIPLSNAIIPIDTVFNISQNGLNLVFKNKEQVSFANTAWKQNDIWTAVIDCSIVEGTKKTSTTTYTQNQNQKITLLDTTLDSNSIKVVVNGETWADALANPFNQTQSTDKVYWLYERPEGGYYITFGNNIIGSEPDNAATVVVTWDSVEADDANGAGTNNIFTSAFSNAYWSIDDITTVEPSSGGAPRQNIESLRSTIPLSYGSQNRWVTDTDYSAAITTLLPSVTATRVWNDGKPGIVNISVLQSNGSPLSNSQKNKIITTLVNKSPIGTNFNFIDPTTLSVNLNFTIFNKKGAQINTNSVNSVLDEYIKNFNGTFGSILELSAIIEALYSVKNISSVEINSEIALTKVMVPNISAFTYTFGVPINSLSSNKFIFNNYNVSIINKGLELWLTGEYNAQIGTISADRTVINLTGLKFLVPTTIQFRAIPDQGKNIPVQQTETISLSRGNIIYKTL